MTYVFPVGGTARISSTSCITKVYGELNCNLNTTVREKSSSWPASVDVDPCKSVYTNDFFMVAFIIGYSFSCFGHTRQYCLCATSLSSFGKCKTKDTGTSCVPVTVYSRYQWVDDWQHKKHGCNCAFNLSSFVNNIYMMNILINMRDFFFNLAHNSYVTYSQISFCQTV